RAAREQARPAGPLPRRGTLARGGGRRSAGETARKATRQTNERPATSTTPTAAAGSTLPGCTAVRTNGAWRESPERCWRQPRHCDARGTPETGGAGAARDARSEGPRLPPSAPWSAARGERRRDRGDRRSEPARGRTLAVAADATGRARPTADRRRRRADRFRRRVRPARRRRRPEGPAPGCGPVAEPPRARAAGS